MKNRTRLIMSSASAVLIGLACIRPALGADEESAVKQAIRNDYWVFYQERNREKYRSLLTDDYLLLENGDILDIDGDMALMPASDSEEKRTDNFDFRSVKIYGDIAYAVYLLKSEITDKRGGKRTREFLESAILRRTDGRWRVALLHSTRRPRQARQPSTSPRPDKRSNGYTQHSDSALQSSASAHPALVGHKRWIAELEPPGRLRQP